MLISFLVIFSAAIVFNHFFLKVGGIGILVNDNNKPVSRTVMSGGGVGIVIIVASFYMFLDNPLSLSLAGVTIVAFLIGLYDDFKPIRVWTKVPLMLIPPLIIAIISLFHPLWKHTEIFGIEFGILYWILLLPIIYMGFSNAANIIAGYDGLEGGVYLLILFVYIIIGYLSNNAAVLWLSVPLFLSILSFEFYNIPPSKLVMGNAGSFSIGGLLGIIPLIGHFEVILPIVFMPHLIEFFFKVKYKGETSVFGVVDKNGIIHNKNGIKSVIHWIISLGGINEKMVTLVMLSIEGILCASAFLLWFLLH